MEHGDPITIYDHKREMIKGIIYTDLLVGFSDGRKDWMSDRELLSYELIRAYYLQMWGTENLERPPQMWYEADCKAPVYQEDEPREEKPIDQGN